MRRLLLASCLVLLPGLAMAQTAANPPPPPGDDGYSMMNGPDGGPPGPDMMGGPDMKGGWGKGGRHGMDPAAMLIDFYAANTTHDGHLTLAQAKAANYQPVADHFAEIDASKRGYVTFYDIEAWRLDLFAKRLEARADQLRAKD